eukprot:5067320-Pyramimonas_sp.AAC.1
MFLGRVDCPRGMTVMTPCGASGWSAATTMMRPFVLDRDEAGGPLRMAFCLVWCGVVWCGVVWYLVSSVGWWSGAVCGVLMWGLVLVGLREG